MIIIEYWASLHSSHGHGANSASNAISSEEKYVHEFSSVKRLQLTQEEIDAINTGAWEVSDWKKIKPLSATSK